MVETQSDEILRGADTEDVSLLVVGDPFGCVILCLRLTDNRSPTHAERRHTRTSYCAPALYTYPHA